ncbi:membrane hypothetical protein [Azospirillaceae bacterium]
MDVIIAFLNNLFTKITTLKIPFVHDGDYNGLFNLFLFYVGLSLLAMLTGSATSAQLIRRWIKTIDVTSSFRDSLLSGALTVISSVPKMISGFLYFFFLSLICLVKCLFALTASIFLGLLLTLFMNIAWESLLHTPLPNAAYYLCIAAAFTRLFGKTTLQNVKNNLLWKPF